MINQKNKRARVGTFGASDTHYIMGNWATATFLNWWQSKMGIKDISFRNNYTLAGTHKEHQLADWYEQKYNVKLRRDRRHRVPFSKLVINYDCESKEEDIEIKTYKFNADKDWVYPRNYWEQVQVQMYGGKKKAKILAYGLLEDDYENFYLPTDENRIKIFDIDYDKDWVYNEYLPREKYLEWCLKKRKTPNKEEFERRNKNEKN